MKTKFNQLVSGLHNFMKQAGKTRAVLGLSGGVDSALTAKIAAEALGPANVSGIIMPNENLTNPQNVTDAEEWARELGIQYFIVPINPFLEVYKSLAWEASVLADMNLNARVRANILYHFANTHDAIVLGTGNKTELRLGYFTKYGDGACDVEVIGNLFKTEVWEMARTVGVPEKIVKKVPSAELAHGQTDEKELGMSYLEADALLRALERGEVVTGPAAEKLRARMAANRHKTELPPSLPR